MQKSSEKQPSVVGLFSGCGGLDLGFKRAGFDILWANDFNADSVKTYEKYNFLKNLKYFNQNELIYFD